MNKESMDEEYLDKLLNSVTDNSDDNDSWFEDELNMIDDIKFEDSDDDIINEDIGNESINDEEINEKDITKDIVNDNIIKDDVNDINVNEVTDDEDEELEDIMKLLDSYESENDSNNKNNDKESSDKEEIRTDDITKDILADVSDKLEADDKQNKEDMPDKKKKEKKDSIIKRLFSKKDKKKNEYSSEDLNNINADEILNETGSAFDEMKELVLDDVVIQNRQDNLFGDIESLDDIPDIDEENKKEKKKKKEKVKKEKVPKPKKVKVKKEKRPLRPDEYIKISPLFIVLSVTLIAVFILAVYFGASTFSYNSNIDKASNYYVDKEYEKAYEILAGMDIKEKDINFYNQVKNIMKVEKEINNFHSYMKLEMYAYALESLVRGVKNFDESLNRASDLGTYDILIEKSEEIDELLKQCFNMGIEEARTINQLDNNLDFSKAINQKAKNINISTQEGTQGN